MGCYKQHFENHDWKTPDKPPWFPAVVGWTSFPSCQLQRHGSSDSWIQVLDLLFAVYVAPLSWGTASFVCPWLTNSPLELSIQSQPSLSSLPPANGETLWLAIVRISCYRKGERREARQPRDNSRAKRLRTVKKKPKDMIGQDVTLVDAKRWYAEHHFKIPSSGDVCIQA